MMNQIDQREPSGLLHRLYEHLRTAPVTSRPNWHGFCWPAVVLLLVVQVLTGVVLMTVYSPSMTSAWASVWYVQTQVPGGWLIRGVHHFASDALLILLAIYGLLMVINRAYRAPTRFAWWIVIGLLGLALGLSLTGHLLPWDQVGYWGTTVRANILARTPVVGDALHRLLLGGSDMGALTLTRFYTMHVIVLPVLAFALVVWHTRLIRKRVACPTESGGGPERTRDSLGELLRGSIVFLGVLVAVVAVTWYRHHVRGDELLAAPADPLTTDYPARPEWHTLFLFQWLKYFEGSVVLEVVGAVIMPSLVVALFLGLPFLQRVFRSRSAHRIALTYTVVVVGGIGWLSYVGVAADLDPTDERVEAARAKQRGGEVIDEVDTAALRARQFNTQRRRARVLAHRALELAAEHGIPPTGPLGLLADDPVTRGPVLFAENCAACHRYDGHDGLGNVPVEPATSSDLAGFATREWIRGLLTNPMAEKYFGRMTKPDGEPAHTRMKRFVEEAMEDLEDDQARKLLTHDYNAVAAYLEFESVCPGPWDDDGTVPIKGPCSEWAQFAPKLAGRPWYPVGRRVFMNVCNECHSYDGERSGTFRAPEMMGYGSVEWIKRMVTDPAHESRYRSRGREPAQMPAFADRLSERDRGLIARWLHDSRRTGTERSWATARNRPDSAEHREW